MRTESKMREEIREQQLEHTHLSDVLDMLPGESVNIDHSELLRLAAWLIKLYHVAVGDSANRALLERTIAIQQSYVMRAKTSEGKSGPEHGVFQLTADLLENAKYVVARHIVRSDTEAVLMEAGSAMAVTRSAALQKPSEEAEAVMAEQIYVRLYNVVVDALAESYLKGMGASNVEE